MAGSDYFVFSIHFMIIMMISTMNQPQQLFFEYSSKGTYSRQNLQVTVFADGTVHYKRTKFTPEKVLEEWTGSLTAEDTGTFVNTLIYDCRFRDLPEKPDEEIRIKDSAFEEITVHYEGQKHRIGGYAAFHYKKYQCVYQAYRKMLSRVRVRK